MVDNIDSDQLADGEEFVDVNAPDVEVQDTQEAEAEPTEEVSEPEYEIPQKFQGKSIEDVAKSYEELERELGRKGNEIGELRKLTDQLLQLQVAEKQEASKVQPEPVKSIDFDSLVENPEQALNSAVDNNPRLKALEEKLLGQERQAAQVQFEKQHPDWQNILQSNEFQGWIQQNPALQRTLIQADQNYDYQTGGEILTLYKELKAQAQAETQAEQKQKRSQALKDGATERGGTGQAAKKIFRRADLINLKVTNPTKYEAMLPEIERAYAEDRVR